MNIEIPIKCEKCGRTIKKKLSELQRKQDITCRCGATITIDPKGFKSVGKNAAEFDKLFKK